MIMTPLSPFDISAIVSSQELLRKHETAACQMRPGTLITFNCFTAPEDRCRCLPVGLVPRFPRPVPGPVAVGLGGAPGPGAIGGSLLRRPGPPDDAHQQQTVAEQEEGRELPERIRGD